MVSLPRDRTRSLSNRIYGNQGEERDVIAMYVGYVTMVWAEMETYLDDFCRLALRNGGKQVASELPRSLKRKTSFLKRCSVRLTWMTVRERRVVAAMMKVDALSITRHDLTHGRLVLSHFLDTDNALFARHNYGPEDYTISQREFVHSELLDLVSAIVVVRNELIELMRDFEWPLIFQRLYDWESRTDTKPPAAPAPASPA